MEGTLNMSNFKFWSSVCLFLDPNIVTKIAIRFFLRWNLLNKTLISSFRVGIFRGVPPRTHNLKILSTPLSFSTKFMNESAIRFVLWWNLLNETDWNSDFALFPIQVPMAKLRLEVLLKKCHPWINLTTQH
jgi:hypothetical protein